MTGPVPAWGVNVEAVGAGSSLRAKTEKHKELRRDNNKTREENSQE